MQINVLEYLEQGSLVACPDKVAIVDGPQTITFVELDKAARCCASRIAELIPEINCPIAVFLPKCIMTVVADIGILMSGNCFTNLDTKSPDQRISNILENVEPPLVITSVTLESTVRQLGAKKILLIEDAVAAPRSDTLIVDRRARIVDMDPACIINTSGSTGIPKSVVMNHRSIIDFMDWLFRRFGFGSEGRIGSLSPFYFDIYTLELWYCMAKGATIIIIPEQLALFPLRMVEFLRDQAISFIFWVPTVMVNIANQDIFMVACPKSLKNVLFAGEVFPTKHLNYWRRNLPDARFVNLYGPIEITVDCTYYEIDREFADDDPLPIGFPCRNTDILILAENDEIAKVGEHGELCVRGSSLAMGYWNDPEKTSKAFVQNPLNTKYPELIYRTGDIVHMNERGEIMFDGRKDFQVKHQGYRIELSEVEHVLLSSMKVIDNACVLYNHTKKEITLFYESKEQVTPAEIRQRIGKILPKYMLPTAFHHLESMPRNPNGKIDRQSLMSEMNNAGTD